MFSILLSCLVEHHGPFKRNVALGYNTSLTPKWGGITNWAVGQSTHLPGSKRNDPKEKVETEKGEKERSIHKGENRKFH